MKRIKSTMLTNGGTTLIQHGLGHAKGVRNAICIVWFEKKQRLG
jgi:hypothetical protein